MYEDLFFFLRERKEGKNSQCAVIACILEACSAHEGNRSPQTTSEVVGTLPSAPKPPRRSSNDMANACAAQHDNAVHQRLNHERRATARISGGSDLALARARCRKKSWASSDHLLPVSQARTTKRARQSTQGICAPSCGVRGREQPRLGWPSVSVWLHRL